MGTRRHVIFKALGLAVGMLAAVVVAAAPVSAAQAVPFNATVSGTLQITGMSENGPTSAVYSGQGIATQLGATRMQGDITFEGPAACPNGFSASHQDTLTASNGDQLFVAIQETSCPRPDGATFDCTGTYTVTGGTGRFSTTSGSGQWSGTVTLSPSGSGTFQTTTSGVLSL